MNRVVFCFVAIGGLAACSPVTTSPSTQGGSPVAATLGTFVVSIPNAPTAYTINGSSNPTITVRRGYNYLFTVTAPNHPFYIMTTPGTNSANRYVNGVTGNGVESGSLNWIVPTDAPNTLYYDCSVHAAMGGTIAVSN